MPIQSTENVKAAVFELCSENDYGSWELWWKVSADAEANQTAQIRERFLDVVSELVSGGKLVAKAHAADGEIASTRFDRAKLSLEVDSAGNPDPESYFWFGTK